MSNGSTAKGRSGDRLLTANGRNPMFNGRRQPSRGGTSRMTRECQVRFCERFPRAYSAFASKAAEAVRPCTSVTPPKADVNSPPWLPPLSAKDRDRGEPRGSAPPTPPGIRVRTAAVREVGLTSSEQGGETERSEVCIGKPQ